MVFLRQVHACIDPIDARCARTCCALASRDNPAVRIAFSGSHRVGKSTLVEQVARALPQYTAVDEPYHLLEEDGYEFDWPPSAEDFRTQLERSVLEIETAGGDVLFDRCPVDLLAYLLVEGQEIEPEIEQAREAMQLLDLVVLFRSRSPIALQCRGTRTATGVTLCTRCSRSCCSMTTWSRTC